MSKCPICGYDPDKHIVDYPILVKQMLNPRSEKTQIMIKKLFHRINLELPTDWLIAPPQKQYEFLKAIEFIPDTALKKILNDLLESKAVHDQKGLNYIKAIVLNRYNNHKALSNKERKKIGKAPKRFVKNEQKN